MHESSHRVLVAEQPLHYETVDDDDRGRGGIVARVEPSSCDQSHAHRLQVVVTDRADLRIVRVAAHLVRRASLRDERAELIDEAQQRPCVREARALNARQCAQFVDHALDQLGFPSRRIVLRHDEIEGEDA